MSILFLVSSLSNWEHNMYVNGVLDLMHIKNAGNLALTH